MYSGIQGATPNTAVEISAYTVYLATVNINVRPSLQSTFLNTQNLLSKYVNNPAVKPAAAIYIPSYGVSVKKAQIKTIICASAADIIDARADLNKSRYIRTVSKKGLK